jgi:hypothetical protein
MIELPTVRGVIRRRVLVNFRVDADVAQRQLPAPFRPRLLDGQAVAGICLIRLEHGRPRLLPLPVGLASENAAHRVAVEWEDAAGSVGYSPRRRGGQLEGLRLVTRAWAVEPLAVEHVRSSYFADQRLFPPGAVELDCALLMRDLEHEWHSLPSLAATAPDAAPAER